MTKTCSLIFSPYSHFSYCPNNVLTRCSFPFQYPVKDHLLDFVLGVFIIFFFYDMAFLEIQWIILQNICLVIPYQIQIRHFWQEYYTDDLYLSQCITFRNTGYHFVPLLVIESLITWLYWFLPDFPIIKGIFL